MCITYSHTACEIYTLRKVEDLVNHDSQKAENLQSLDLPKGRNLVKPRPFEE